MSLELNDSGKDKIQDMLFRKGLILESMIKKRAPVYTGNYKASWETQKNADGSVTVGTPQTEKGMALEYGGEPGTFPPVDELRKWVDRKLPVEDVDSVAYLIGREIEENGINPNPHVRPAIREFKRKEL